MDSPSGGPRNPTPESERRRPSQSRKPARRYRFACTSCKARKVKCSGDQPICRSCRRSGVLCVWQARSSAESRLQDANAQIQILEAALQTTDASPPRPGAVGGNVGLVVGASVTASATVAGTSPPSTATSSPLDVPYATPVPAPSPWFQVGVGDDGAVTYNGPTSRFHAGPLEENAASEVGHEKSRERAHPSIQRASHIDALRTQYDLIDTVWMPLIESKPMLESFGVSTDICMALLDIYWTWLQPLHNCVYRPIFLMDMAICGPYYSDFLLMSIFSLAARHLSEQDQTFRDVGKGEHFLSRAKELLLEEMSATRPRITTIQGLLILGGRQCAMGLSSEGWLYTGMAIRMLVDIGLHLHLDNSKLTELERLTPAEVETRKRLYNSAYIWDKTLSLALGRPPSLTRRPHGADDVLDHYDDHLEWGTVHAPEIGEGYTPVPSYNTLAFCAHCQLHEITTEMLLLFANTSGVKDFGREISLLDAKFSSWNARLPEQLRVDNPASLSQSPPPHIISLNLLYHALCILLYRPNLSSSHAGTRASSTERCTAHSKSISAICALYGRTFPYRLMTYQVSYCVFTAASVDAHEMKTRGPQTKAGKEAALRLGAAICVLQHEARHTPGIGRSLDTIRRRLTSWTTTNGSGAEQDRQRNLWKPSSATRAAPGRRSDVDVMEQSSSVSGTANMALTEAASVITGVGYQVPHQYSQQEPPTETVRGPREPFFLGNVNSAENPSANLGNFDFGGLDTGAGFHPDAFPWSMLDILGRDPGVEMSSGLLMSGWNDVGA